MCDKQLEEDDAENEAEENFSINDNSENPMNAVLNK